jgi:hypothetical protein
VRFSAIVLVFIATPMVELAVLQIKRMEPLRQ